MEIHQSLLNWVNSFDNVLHYCQQHPLSSMDSLLDGKILSLVFNEIWKERPHLFKPKVAEEEEEEAVATASESNWTDHYELWKSLNKDIQVFFNEIIHQDFSHFAWPNVILIAKKGSSSTLELVKLMVIMLTAAVHCEHKDIFVNRILTLDSGSQAVLMNFIQNPTDILPSNSGSLELNEKESETVEFLKMSLEELEDKYGELNEQHNALQEDYQKLATQLKSNKNDATSVADAVRSESRLRIENEKLVQEIVMLTEENHNLQDLAKQNELKIANFTRQVEKLSTDAAKVQNLRDQVDDLKAEKSSIRKLESNNAALKKRLANMDMLEQKLKDLEEENSAYAKTVAKLESEVAEVVILKTKNKLYVSKIENLEAENRRYLKESQANGWKGEDRSTITVSPTKGLEGSQPHHLESNISVHSLKDMDTIEDSAHDTTPLSEAIENARQNDLNKELKELKKENEMLQSQVKALTLLTAEATPGSSADSEKMKTLQKELEKKKKLVEKLQAELASLKENTSPASKDALLSLQKQLQEKQTALESLENQLNNRENRISKLENERSRWRDEREQLYENINKLDTNLEEASSQYREANKTIRQQRDKISLLNSKVSEMEDETKSKDLRIQQLEAHIVQKKNELQESRRLVAQLEKEAGSLISDLHAAQRSLTDAQLSLRRAEGKQDAESNQTFLDRIESLDKESKRREQRIQELSLELIAVRSSKQQEIEKNVEKVIQLQEEVEQLKAEKAKLAVRIESLENEKKNLEEALNAMTILNKELNRHLKELEKKWKESEKQVVVVSSELEEVQEELRALRIEKQTVEAKVQQEKDELDVRARVLDDMKKQLQATQEKFISENSGSFNKLDELLSEKIKLQNSLLESREEALLTESRLSKEIAALQSELLMLKSKLEKKQSSKKWSTLSRTNHSRSYSYSSTTSPANDLNDSSTSVQDVATTSSTLDRRSSLRFLPKRRDSISKKEKKSKKSSKKGEETATAEGDDVASMSQRSNSLQFSIETSSIVDDDISIHSHRDGMPERIVDVFDFYEKVANRTLDDQCFDPLKAKSNAPLEKLFEDDQEEDSVNQLTSTAEAAAVKVKTPQRSKSLSHVFKRKNSISKKKIPPTEENN